MTELPKAKKWDLVRGTNLQSEDRFCLMTLFLFQGDREAAFCKQSTLADEMGLTTRSVRRRLERLADLGIIDRTWGNRSGLPIRFYSINFEALKSVQRPVSTRTPASECNSDTRTSTSYCESDSRTPASAPPGHQRPLHQDTSVLHEYPRNIHRTSTNAKTSFSLVSFCRIWNQWQEAGIVSKKIRDPEKPGKGLKTAWKRSQADPEQRDRLRDSEKLRLQLEASKGFLFDAGWFDAVALIGGKNNDRRFYAEMLLNGAYAENKPSAESDDWPAVHRIVRETYAPDVRNVADVKARLSPEQFQAAQQVGIHRIADANQFDKQTPAAYRQARKAVSA